MSTAITISPPGTTTPEAALVDELTALLEELVASGAALGWIEQLTLDARGDNASAHALWQSRGFVQYGMLTDFVAVAEARYDKTFWVLDLRDS